MALFSVVELLPRASLVDAHHGNTNRPRGLADAQAEVVIVGVDIAPLLESLDYLNDGFDEGVVEIAGFEFSK